MFTGSFSSGPGVRVSFHHPKVRTLRLWKITRIYAEQYKNVRNIDVGFWVRVYPCLDSAYIRVLPCLATGCFCKVCTTPDTLRIYPCCLNSTYTFRRQTPVSSFLVVLVFRRLFCVCFDLSFIPSLWSFHTSFHSTIYRYTCLKTTVVTILTVSVRLLSIYHYVRCLYITLLSPFIAFVYIFYISLYVRRSQTVSWRFKSTVFTTLKSLFSQMCS